MRLYLVGIARRRKATKNFGRALRQTAHVALDEVVLLADDVVDKP